MGELLLHLTHSFLLGIDLPSQHFDIHLKLGGIVVPHILVWLPVFFHVLQRAQVQRRNSLDRASRLCQLEYYLIFVS